MRQNGEKKKELEVLYVKAEMRDTIKEEQIKTGQIFFLIYSFILFWNYEIWKFQVKRF